jgi:transcriptional regulator GlxA family with amidase domain
VASHGMNDICSLNLARLVMHQIVFLAYDGFQILDVTGPASVFAEASEIAGTRHYDIVVASLSGGLVASGSGIEIATAKSKDVPLGRASSIIIPGASEGPLRVAMTTGHSAWIASNSAGAARICSVCTGAFLLAASGILPAGRITTHWMATGRLSTMFPKLTVDERALYVRDGRVWTSAGVSTGIDMALALVEEDFGRSLATKVAKKLVLQSRRPGHQSQFSTLLELQDGAYAELTDWISNNLNADLSLEALAARCAQSTRTFHRKFSRETGMSPAALVEHLRLDRARSLLEAGESVKTAASVSGFGSLDRLGRCFVRRFNLTPSQYRLLHASQ